jgi:SNF2 family DNA or RNA helicase
MVASDFALCVMPVGAGKTAIALTVLDKLAEDYGYRTLVLAPLRVAQQVWPAQVAEWSHLNTLNVSVAAGLGVEARKRIIENRDYDVVTLNVDLAPWLFETYKPGTLPFDVLVVDEASAFKNVSTARFKKMRPHLPHFSHRYALTATPTANSLLDVWAPAFIADLGAALGRSFYGFQRKMFYPLDYKGFRWGPLPGTPEKVMAAIEPFTFRIPEEELVKLPDLTINKVEVELPAKARATYEELKAKMVTQLEHGESIFAASQGVLTVKLQQVVAGFLYGEDKKTTWIHNTKMDAVEELVDGLDGSPTLLFYWFEAEEDELRERFPHARFLCDAHSDEATRTMLAEWNAGKIEVLAVHPASAGHGLNLQGAAKAAGAATANMIWTGPIWSNELWQQALGRIHRQGQAAPCFVHVVVAKDTVDMNVLDALRSKQNVHDAVIGGLTSV